MIKVLEPGLKSPEKVLKLLGEEGTLNPPTHHTHTIQLTLVHYIPLSKAEN